MPKETFFNLSREKQRRIFDAAVREFSQQRFSAASINQIIKTAGIPRGSFYQYFNDKEDLYLYMMAEIGKEKLEILSHVGDLNPEADFFEAYHHMLKSGLEWAQARPMYQRIGMLMEMDDSEFITKIRERSQEAFTFLNKMISRDQQRGLIRPDIDPNLVVEMIYALNMHLLKEYLHSGCYEGLLGRANEIVSILKEGIAGKN